MGDEGEDEGEGGEPPVPLLKNVSLLIVGTKQDLDKGGISKKEVSL